MGCWQKQLGSCLRLAGDCLELQGKKVKGFPVLPDGSLKLDLALLWILFHNFDQEQGFLLGCSAVPKQTRNNINSVA
jgi:hypothetical protein